ncbi:MAG: LrgB family protein [Pacificimonas sp.]
MTAGIIESSIACLLTIAAFVSARGLARLAEGHPLANPVLVGALIVATFLIALDVSVPDYLTAAHPLMDALDLAIVALGYGLVQQLRGSLSRLGPALIAIVTSLIVGVGSAVGLAIAFDLPGDFVDALSVKTVSSGFAVAIMERVAGPPSLAAGLVIATGMIGALSFPILFRKLRIADAESRGIATGMAAHIVGTESLFRADARAGAWAALAMALAGLIAGVALPLLWRVFA